MTGNANLHSAKSAKRDEFYTQTEDIQAELQHYREHFANKTVYLNCDDPYESNFFRYFALNFNRLALKRLIATSFKGSPVAGTRLKFSREPHVIDVREVADYNGDGKVDLDDVVLQDNRNRRPLKGDGDFRSAECIELLTQADIVVTNPPFSLFREYLAQLIEHDRDFLVIGSLDAITYKEVFPLLHSGQMWLGHNNGGDKWFKVPDHYSSDSAGHEKTDNGIKYLKLRKIVWFTNLDHAKRHEDLILTERYSKKAYPKYDNYDAINVDKVALIPKDYDKPMGVPISYLDKHNPEQFEIVESKAPGSLPLFIDGKKKFGRIMIRRRQS